MHLFFPTNSSRYFFFVVGFAGYSQNLLCSQEPRREKVVPCVVQGICQVCRTSSCSNCPKLCAPLLLKNEEEAKACGCKGVSNFCADTENVCFIDPQAKREICKGKNPCSMRRAPSSVFIPRSQGTNTARELVGWEEFIHQFDVGDYYLTTGHVLAYYHSFRSERIARELFGETVLRFAGSKAEGRDRCEILADNFGLSDTLRGRVTVHPVIENIVFDNQFFLGLDPLLCGLYLRVHMPLVHTRWNLHLCQTIERDKSEEAEKSKEIYKSKCPDFPSCYMADSAVPAQCNIIKALEGRFTFGDMKTPWAYGRIFNGPQTKTGLADLDLILGYDFRQTDTSHLGLYAQAVFPTGNKLTGRELFQPLVGNAHHFEVGLGVSAHIVLLESDAHSNLAFYLEGNVVHMFKNTQMRSFDFCNNGPLSRYMLLKELKEVDGQLVYAGNLINGINFATRPVSVSVPAKGDISAKLAVRTPHIIADIGYNFYGRTAERVHFEACKDDRIYAIKGTEGVCGLEYETVNNTFGSFVQDVPLNSSQSHATIRRGARTDNAQPAPKEKPSDIVVTAFSRQTGTIEGADVIPAFVSAPPCTVSVKDLHKATGTSPSQATHKVFGYLGYNFYQCDWCASPYLGIGGEVEFDALYWEDRSSLNQWSVWLKGGFEF